MNRGTHTNQVYEAVKIHKENKRLAANNLPLKPLPPLDQQELIAFLWLVDKKQMQDLENEIIATYKSLE